MAYKSKEDYEFDAEMFGYHFLQLILDWIVTTMSPSEIYPKETLELWAEGSGYVLKGEAEQDAN